MCTKVFKSLPTDTDVSLKRQQVVASYVKKKHYFSLSLARQCSFRKICCVTAVKILRIECCTFLAVGMQFGAGGALREKENVFLSLRYLKA